ncbi:MAG: hypothetical protein JKY08_04370 [Flavobacteriaceae bacterium]|nr:hypothetical protein [Flavobacteriaceae bacterium]
MKNNIKYLMLAAITVGLYSCDDEDYSLAGTYIGGNTLLSDTKISVFDINEDLSMYFITADGLTVDAVEISKDGSKIADAIVSGETAVFSSSTLGDFLFGDDLDEPTGSFDVNFVSTLSNGQTYINDYTIKVVKAITASEKQASVKYLDTTPQKIVFKSFSNNSTIDSKTFEWKKGKNGTYEAITNPAFDGSKLTIQLNEHEYATTYGLVAMDTLYYRVTVTSGTMTDSEETSVAIVAQEMTSSNSGMLSTASPQFNFTDHSPNNGEVIYTSPVGMTVIAEASKGLEFVPITLPGTTTAEDYYAAGDIVDAKDQFAIGTSMTALTDLEKDMIFVYKIIRVEQNEDDEDVNQTYYGLLKITDIITTNNNVNKEINFEYKEGYIIGE